MCHCLRNSGDAVKVIYCNYNQVRKLMPRLLNGGLGMASKINMNISKNMLGVVTADNQWLLFNGDLLSYGI